jgi:hypothetical protein
LRTPLLYVTHNSEGVSIFGPLSSDLPAMGTALLFCGASAITGPEQKADTRGLQSHTVHAGFALENWAHAESDLYRGWRMTIARGAYSLPNEGTVSVSSSAV